MAVSTQVFAQLTGSAQRAVEWAIAAAAHREGQSPGPQGPPVDPFDLLVGVLLAHPDPDGEASVLLHHFGLTARDVLPPNYPSVSAEELQRRAAEVTVSVPVLSPSAEAVVNRLASFGTTGPVRLYHLLGALLSADTELKTPLVAALAAAGDTLDAVNTSYGRWLRTDAEKAKVAGRSLREWLRRNNRRRPVDVPAYASDRVDPRHDLIGIAAEADAFAYLLASRDLTPPLAIGLFGEWGSGKSFLMQAVQDRIRTLGELVAETAQDAAPIWKQIKQIEFNAWEYVQGDLWAGLLERIFRELGSPATATNLVDTVRKPLRAELETEQGRVSEAAEQVRALGENVRKLAEVEKEARKTAEQARTSAPGRTEELLADRGRRAVLDALGAIWGGQRLSIVGRDGVDLLDALSEARTELRRSSLLGPYWQQPRRIILISLAAALIPLTAYLLTVLDVSPLVSLLGGLAAVVPVVTTAVRAAATWSHQRLADLEAAEAKIRQDIEQDVADKQRKAEEAERALDAAREQLAAQQTRRDELRQRADALRLRIAELTPARVFVEFADERSSDYRRRLGLLSKVRQDLLKIQSQLRNNNAKLLGIEAGSPDAALPNRIVLYIDDLDRCPPGKVVEVLEAVHLLLAFEMFVVVVAVDTRWLSAALTDQLPALADSGPGSSRPAPGDYLEKIFQVPYWVQPLTDEAGVQLVRGLLAATVRSSGDGHQDRADPAGLHVGAAEAEVLKLMLGRRAPALRIETSQLTLAPPDLRFIESLAPLVGDTPRRVKRFVNTCQLLLAMRPALAPDGPFPSERHIVCLLAAVNAGPPQVADAIFAAAVSHRPTTLGATADEAAGAAEEAWIPLREWLDRFPRWKTVPAGRLAVRLEMVKRLRFQPPARSRPEAPC